MAILLTDSDQSTQPKQELLAVAAPWAETLSKGVAGIVVAVYACGFLIVSIYHAKYGFVGTNPLRPRVLAAGAWFFLFAAIPFSVAVKFRTDPWSKMARISYPLWFWCYSLVIPLTFFLFEFPVDPQPFNKWSLVLTAIGVAAMITFSVLTDKKKGPQWLLGILSVVTTLYYMVSPIRWLYTGRHVDSQIVVFWLFGATLAIKFEFDVLAGRKLSQNGEWAKPLSLLCLLLLTFARGIYPYLKTSWGGGTPVDVTIYFSKDSLLNPNKAAQVQLIEESDEGFYIVGPKESKAIFVPRSAVAMIFFSDKLSDSPMLQATNPNGATSASGGAK